MLLVARSCVSMSILILPVPRLKLSISFSDPAQSLSTTTLNLFFFLSLSLSRPTETEHTSWSSFDVPCDSHGRFADSPPLGSKRLASLLSLRMLYRISSRPFTSTVQPKSDSLGGCVSTFLQMLLRLVFPCCLVSPLPLPGPCQTCQTQSVRDARSAQEVIKNCLLHLFS